MGLHPSYDVHPQDDDAAESPTVSIHCNARFPRSTDPCSSLAPGAENLIKTLTSPDTPETDRVEVNSPITQLLPKDWANIIKAFNGWKFAPRITDL